jgi:tripartite-type tricarboxylate transporter receptor subunit TctC
MKGRSSRGRLLAALLSTLALGGMAAAPAHGQTDWPSAPIRLISPFAPGGSSDQLARILAPELSQRLGQQVIVENRPGAGGNIGVDAVAKAPPNGSMFVLASPGPMVVNVTLMDSIPYDPVKDLRPVSLIADLPIVLAAHPSVQAKNVAELIALEKARPGSLSFASAGAGTTMHLSGELLNMMAGTKLVHVPYKGAAPAMTDLIGGQVQLAFVDLPTAGAHAKAGRVKILAIGNPRRTQTAPEIPTIGESGVPGYETGGWFGVLAPAGTPDPIIQKMHAVLVDTMKNPAVRERILAIGIEPMATTPDEFAQFIRAEIPKWARVIETSKARGK